MPLHVSSTCTHHHEVKIALHGLWYHHTYRSDDTRGCAMQFWPPDDERMCSKHIEAWNKIIVKQKFCASSWLIAEINILRCTFSKTSKFVLSVAAIWNFWIKIKFIMYPYLIFVLFTARLQKGVFFRVSHIQYDSSLKLSGVNMRSIKVSILVSAKGIRVRQMKYSHLNSQRNRQT